MGGIFFIFFKKLVMAGAIVASLGTGAFVTQPQTVNASSYHKVRVTRSITVYHLIRGNSFADTTLGGHLRLHAGRSIYLRPFYHMGKDGYFVHVPGHGSKMYYARTNSSRWYRR